MGFNIKAVGYKATKLSIDILRRRKIFVTKSSVNMIKELRNYVYITDKAEQSTGVPVDAFNHTIDALRYVALSKLGHWNSGEYFIV
jgi:phage terminase large subunit